MRMKSQTLKIGELYDLLEIDMYLCRDEVVKILETMDKFPEAESFELLQDNSSGIGSVTSLIVRTNVNGLDGEFKTEISGIENW